MQNPKACFHTSSSAFSQKPLSLLNNSSMLKCLPQVHPTSEACPFSRIPSYSCSCVMPGIPHSAFLPCSRDLPGWAHPLFRIYMLVALISASFLRRLLESSLGLKAAFPETIMSKSNLLSFLSNISNIVFISSFSSWHHQPLSHQDQKPQSHPGLSLAYTPHDASLVSLTYLILSSLQDQILIYLKIQFSSGLLHYPAAVFSCL